MHNQASEVTAYGRTSSCRYVISRVTAMQKVEVIDYQKSWIEIFNAEADTLKNSIGFLNPNIHHIGSTSVPGLSAKPIIDILIEIDDVGCLDDHIKILETIGYHGRGENGIPGRRYFEKGGDHRTHQIHAFKRGSYDVMRHLAFRDYLGSHSQVAREYVLLKKQVAETCNNDIDRYCDGKARFIKKHEELAVDWYLHNKRMQMDTAEPHR
jgi:GrpB-like predicted nucleotidyltransferase (UPF0157 family)